MMGQNGHSYYSPYGIVMNGGYGAANVMTGRVGQYPFPNGMPPMPLASQSLSLMAKPLAPQQKFIKLPFYEVQCELIKPVSLLTSAVNRPQEITLSFNLTEAQTNSITLTRDIRSGARIDYENQILFRIGQVHTDLNKVITDEFPSNFSLTVSGKAVQLPSAVPSNRPGMEPKRPPKPMDVTQCCKLSPVPTNTVLLKYTTEFGKGWGCGVWLVKRLTSVDLLSRLKQKSAKSKDATRVDIIEKLGDSDVQLSSLKIKLTCPLSRMRMKYPCRPTTCGHLQCFDAEMFLMMNEKKPTWNCPVCDSKAYYDDLVLDEYFSQVLCSKDLPSDAADVTLLPDGSWTTSEEVEEKVKNEPTTKSAPDNDAPEVEVIELSSDDEDAQPPLPPSNQPPLPPPMAFVPPPPPPPHEIECITLD